MGCGSGIGGGREQGEERDAREEERARGEGAAREGTELTIRDGHVRVGWGY
jgi:hypothetical protein